MLPAMGDSVRDADCRTFPPILFWVVAGMFTVWTAGRCRGLRPLCLCKNLETAGRRPHIGKLRHKNLKRFGEQSDLCTATTWSKTQACICVFRCVSAPPLTCISFPSVAPLFRQSENSGNQSFVMSQRAPTPLPG